ncbi:syntaxin, Qa-SNARE family [Plasmodium reichenowi]|uniref:Syntaxin, Qa-SNARE family n=1 Tax=Plasmodium reichenowi TaxID=5854 RepID=A0A060S528_PLARE|nr:syntaxin, Qa-SNARE family [Plasmodium reichenowi]SOV82874.1 syntaxin, Qa-SNARE family [Plasmodium reichenowi]
MEDILNEIISLSEKKRKEEQLKDMEEKDKKKENDHIVDIKKIREEKSDYDFKIRKENKNTIKDIISNKKKKSSDSIKDDNTSIYCDASTICTIDDDINIEKANIFSKIIHDKKMNEDNYSNISNINNNNNNNYYDDDILYFKDLENNIDENTPLKVNGFNNNLNSYLLHVNDINTHISSIYKNIDKINVIKKKIDLNIYDNEKLYNKVNVIITNSEDIVKYIKLKINELNNENNEFERNSNMVSEIKLRINIFIDVVNKYKSCINKYKNICNQYYEYVNKNIIKHYKLIHPNLNDHTIHKLLKQNNNNVEDFLNINKNSFYENNIFCTNVEQIEIEKIKKKYNELKNLENNILSLNELYIELAYVIKKRKNLINNIENNVFQVKEYTQDALNNIVDAKKYNAMIKQRILYFSIFLLIVAFIILFPVFFNYTIF